MLVEVTDVRLSDDGVHVLGPEVAKTDTGDAVGGFAVWGLGSVAAVLGVKFGSGMSLLGGGQGEEICKLFLAGGVELRHFAPVEGSNEAHGSRSL